MNDLIIANAYPVSSRNLIDDAEPEVELRIVENMPTEELM